jgi:hypothetical protein
MKRLFLILTPFIIFISVTAVSSTSAWSQEITIFEDSGVRLMYPGGSGIPTAIDVADVNRDGYLDIGLGNHCYDDYIFINLGEMQFEFHYGIGGWGNPNEAIFADIDGDGDLDFLTGDSEPLGGGHIVISVNDGNGMFSAGPHLRPVMPPWPWAYYPRAYVVGDFTGNSLPDIVAGEIMFVNEGGLNFSEYSAPGIGTALEWCAVSADIDADGDLDIVDRRSIYLNDGSGRFVRSDQHLYGGYGPTMGHRFADFDADGSLDLVMYDWFSDQQQLMIYLNDGAGNFQLHQELPSPRSYTFAVGDFNNDGSVDLASASIREKINIYLNDGTGAMIGPVQTIPIGCYELAVGDMNNDCLVDLVIPEYRNNGWTHIWLNVANRPPTADAGPAQTVAAGPDCTATVTLDGSGSTDPDSTPGTNDDIVSFDWHEGDYFLESGETIEYFFTLGEHIITLVVTDSYGETNDDNVIVTIQDTTPPGISLSVIPNTLWPPNHKMVLITPTITASDNCDPDPVIELTSITMNEGDETGTYDPNYDDGIGDGHTVGDIQVDEDGNIYLRAERSGMGSGRIYTIKSVSICSGGTEVSAYCLILRRLAIASLTSIVSSSFAH